MKYRNLGKTGLKVSEIAIGSWLTYGGTVEDQIAKKCLATALENGVNFIDSAEIYAKGGAERVIGEFLKEETYNRKDLVISSKVFWPMSEDINRWGLSRKNILNAIEGTLERLNTDYIDIYFMHRYDYTTPLEETIEVLDDLIHEGKVHYWGTSVWTAAQLVKAVFIAKELKAHQPVVEQPLYNMLVRYIELEIMPTAQELGIGFTVWSPLAQGLLTGKYNEGIPEGSRAEKSEFLKKNLTEENISKVRELTKIAKELDISMSQLALAWILRRSEISAAIIGATKPEQVAENVKASDVILSEEVLEQIEQILDNTPQWPLTYKPNLYYTEKMRK
ncbi:MAG: aldo/keto reductase family protein [Candidatus Heimdallarchaeaceae archaeon]